MQFQLVGIFLAFFVSSINSSSLICKLWILFLTFWDIWTVLKNIIGYFALSYIEKLISTGTHFFSYFLLINKFVWIECISITKHIWDMCRSLSIKLQHIWSLLTCFHLRKKSFFWSVNCTSWGFISQHILDMDNVLIESF